MYATSAKGLLVFDEPDFPEVALQVPGGTVEPDETAEAAALREFSEETGLIAVAAAAWLDTRPYSFVRDGVTHTHHRSYFHMALPDDLPAEWLHHEQTPFDGSPPILFRFFWISIAAASRRLGYGMEAALDRLAARTQ